MTDHQPLNDDTGNHPVREVFGNRWRWWVMVKEQFSPTSLSVIGAVLLAAFEYSRELHSRINVQENRIVILETRIIPFVQNQSNLSAIVEKLNSHDVRLTRLEASWDNAGYVAHTVGPHPRAQRH